MGDEGIRRFWTGLRERALDTSAAAVDLTLDGFVEGLAAIPPAPVVMRHEDFARLVEEEAEARRALLAVEPARRGYAMKTKTDGHWSSDTATDDELRAILGDAVAEQVIAARKEQPVRYTMTMTFEPPPEPIPEPLRVDLPEEW